MGSLESPVGYFFADVEGSTERWEKAPGPMQIAMARLEALTDELFAQHGGVIQDRAGDGVFAIFKLGNPLQCALEMQLAMQRSDWSSVGGLDLRIGVHAGEDVGDNQVDRVVANRGARIMSSGWGGQIVVSDDAADNFGTPEHAQLRDLGVCRFKGIKDALHLASLVHPALRRTEFPPLRSTLFDGAAAEMLAGPIFGRQAELSEVVSTLSQRRLVTLVGLGGNGKTRLALQVGAEVASSKPVCFASLEALAGPAELPVALASCLGLQLGAGRSADQQIIDYLQDKQMLLVVDNAETVAGRARLLGDIVASCPSISILATSREPLDVQGEALVRIDGLEALTSGSSPALELFAYEARLKDPSFAVREDQLPVFRKITALLEGSPLALRLTAKWINVLSLEQILTRLVQSVELLESPEASDQRQTMRGVFDGSWRFLTPAQQTGLARLSIFIKAFDIAAATKIAEIDLETFADLERKSLLVRTGQGRFAMHAMVREFARERWTTMGAGEEEHVRLTHAKYYLEAVRTVMEGAPVAERGASLEGLRQDYPEIRAAWLHAVDAGANDLLKSTTEPLCYFLYVRSMMREGVEIFGTTIENAALRRHFASIRANFLVHQGDVEAAGVLASSVLTAEEGPELARAHANHVLGNLAHIRGDFEQADARYNAAFDIRESIGDLRGCCFASLSLAALHLLFSRRETARHHIKRGYRLARQIGEPFGMLASHVYAGDLAATENRVEDAQDNYEMSLRLEDSAPHSQFRAMLHRRLGTLFVLRGDPGSALRHHEEAFDLARELGDQRTAAHALIEIGKDWRLVGNIDRALQNLLRGVRFSMTLGIQSCLQRGLLELSQVALMRGDVGGARRLVSVLEDADLGELRTDYEALLVQLAGGESASFAPVTITDLLNELIAEAETDTLEIVRCKMARGSLVVVGTGIKIANQCTIEARYQIETADIVFEVVGDQLARGFIQSLNANVVSLQHLYGGDRSRRETYDAMVETILDAVRSGKRVCAAFYGHPGVYVFPSHECVKRAREEGYEAEMLPAVSADACIFADLGFDPGWLGCQSFEATDFVINARKFDPTAVLILWQVALVGDRTLRVFESDPRRIAFLAEVLMEDYPPDHLVTVYCAATLPIGEPELQTLPLSRLAEAVITQESTLVVPPLAAAQPSPERIALLQARLAAA